MRVANARRFGAFLRLSARGLLDTAHAIAAGEAFAHVIQFEDDRVAMKQIERSHEGRLTFTDTLQKLR